APRWTQQRQGADLPRLRDEILSQSATRRDRVQAGRVRQGHRDGAAPGRAADAWKTDRVAPERRDRGGRIPMSQSVASTKTHHALKLRATLSASPASSGPDG